MINSNPAFGEFIEKLKAHQLEFVNNFINSDDGTMFLLNWEIGFGKTTALAAAIGRLLEESNKSRILYICQSRILVNYFNSFLQSLNLYSHILDRYRFREIIDESQESFDWLKTGYVSVSTFQFVSQSDVYSQLTNTLWDLVVIDDVFFVGESNIEAILYLLKSCKKSIITTNPTENISEKLLSKDLVVSKICIHDKQFANESSPKPILNEINYNRTESEKEQIKEIITLHADLLKLENGEFIDYEDSFLGTRSKTSITASLLIRRLSSSPMALENTIQRVNKHLSQMYDHYKKETFSNLVKGHNQPDDNELKIVESLIEESSKILIKMDMIEEDSKLNAFISLLKNLYEINTTSKHVFVLTTYIESLYYLSAVLEEEEMPFKTLHGRKEFKEKKNTTDTFSKNGGIVIATNSILNEAYNIGEITDLILYDVPSSNRIQNQIISRTNRIGRSTELNVHIFSPSDTMNSFQVESINKIRNLFMTDYALGLFDIKPR